MEKVKLANASKMSLNLGAALVSALGMLVLVAWHLGWTTIVQLHSSFAPMQYNTALCFLLLGLSILALLWNRTRLAVFFSVSTALVGFLTLCEYVFGASLGIDQLVMDHYITTETSHPGRMAPNTAISFLLSGLATWFGSRKRSRITALLAAITFSIALVAAVGYLFNLPEAYGWGKLTRMAVHTSVAFLVSSSTLFAWAQRARAHEVRPWLSGITAVVGGIASVMLWIAVESSLQGDSHLVAGLTLVLGIASTWLLSVSIDDQLKLRRSNQLLNATTASLQCKTDELEDYLRILSHDLKSPLRNIGILTTWVSEKAEGVLDEQANNDLVRIKDRAEKLEGMINSLVHYARTENRTGSLERIESETLVQYILDIVDIPQEIEFVAQGDSIELVTFRIPLETCLRNLVSNAVKHSDDKTTQITLETRDLGDMVEFSVTDDGPGIPANCHEKVFGLFQTVYGRQDSGTSGMGLAFVKKCIETHGGYISIDSPGEERGAKFILRWPKSTETGSIDKQPDAVVANSATL